jgi:anthranilate synthase component 2
MVLMIDNYDSFTYNVVQYLGELGAAVQVVRNDEIAVADIEALAPEKIVISPGPCTPNEAGISMAVIEEYAGKLPILGICLGHQSIGQVFGGVVVRARKVMHGKTVVERASLPDCLEITAWTQTEAGEVDEIMGLRHRELAIEGVQFHPESILTAHGHDLLRNFLEQ